MVFIIRRICAKMYISKVSTISRTWKYSIILFREFFWLTPLIITTLVNIFSVCTLKGTLKCTYTICTLKCTLKCTYTICTLKCTLNELIPYEPKNALIAYVPWMRLKCTFTICTLKCTLKCTHAIRTSKCIYTICTIKCTLNAPIPHWS